MKHGTAYAKKLKKFYGRIRKVECPPELVEPTDPLEQLVLAMLALETNCAQARRALDKLRTVMVDFNEIRVSPPRQLAAIIAPYVPNSLACATRICGALNAVFNSLNRLSLDALKSIGKREARHRLEKLDALDAYCVASVLLWSLGGHAIPINNRMLEALRREAVVEPSAGLAEVQSFLERHISPSDAKVFCLSLEQFAAQPGTKSKSNPARAAASAKAVRRARPAAARKVASKR